MLMLLCYTFWEITTSALTPIPASRLISRERSTSGETPILTARATQTSLTYSARKMHPEHRGEGQTSPMPRQSVQKQGLKLHSNQLCTKQSQLLPDHVFLQSWQDNDRNQDPWPPWLLPQIILQAQPSYQGWPCQHCPLSQHKNGTPPKVQEGTGRKRKDKVLTT